MAEVTRWLAVFVMVVGLNYLWAVCVTHTAAGKAVRASLSASLLTALSAASTILYVQDRLMVIPAILGAFVGTYFHVRRHAASLKSKVDDQVQVLLD